MKITMKKVECRNISYGGLSSKLVGSISQTVQVVYNGVPNGTMHLKAKVIRNLTNLYGVDCIAGRKLYKILTRDNAAASDNLNDSVATSESSSLHAASEADEPENDGNASSDNSADDLIFNNDDSPRTRKRKRKDRFMIANISFSSSMLSLPPMSPRSSSPAAESLQVPSSHANLTPSSPGHPPIGQTRQEPPPHLQNPPLMLTKFILCGHAPPCSCVETLRAMQLQLLPPHYPVYLPVGHQPCSHACVSHHVHGDNLHPPDPSLCACDPLRVKPGYVPFATHPPEASPKTETMANTTTYVQSVASSKYTCIDCGEQFSACQGNCPESRVFQHISSVGDPKYGGGHDDAPPLPPDFQPCGNYCGYEICQCLRNYEGRDWAS